MDFKSLARRLSKTDEYRAQHWTGSFEEYLELVRKDPRVVRNAFQRIYDMAMAEGFVYVESGPLVRSSYHANRASDAMEALLENSPFQRARAARKAAEPAPGGTIPPLELPAE